MTPPSRPTDDLEPLVPNLSPAYRADGGRQRPPAPERDGRGEPPGAGDREELAPFVPPLG